jgi:hemimethylated DNA binding protein
VERCEYLLDEAIQMEEYDEAEGLQMRIERLRDTHPIWPVEQSLSDAIVEGDFETARRLHTLLEDIRWNLGLPKFLVGQVVESTVADLRAVVVSVDISCQMPAEWLRKARDANVLRLDAGMDQPFYTLLVDERDDQLTPRELYIEQQNVYSDAPRPSIYLPQEAVALCHDEQQDGFEHELAKLLFESPTPQAPDGLGMRLKPTIKLRLWQRQQLERIRGHSSSI